MSQERYIVYKYFTENVGTVSAIYVGSLPVDIPEGFFTESPDPIKIDIPNLDPVLRVRLDTKELYYDYESNESLNMRVTNIQSDLSQLSSDKQVIEENVEELSTEITFTQVAVTEAYESSLDVEEDNTRTQVALTEVYEELLRTQAALSTVNLAIQALQTEIALLKGE